ncbi:hypothetical protein IWW36_001154 [Coemansia brasiliensis]|uniref:TH1 protein n=1 Tax=Coemansia brasiliensis TaxID=2650707 RepID=A0A9W8I9J3_9FUNG|nr:hypothetical protein IWW36_001154 [Coemansia brasiliensis]
MAMPVNSSNENSVSLDDTEQKQRLLEEAKAELTKKGNYHLDTHGICIGYVVFMQLTAYFIVDAIMEPTAEKYAEQFLEAGGAPLNVMNMLKSGYEGMAAITNTISTDMGNAFSSDVNAAITDAISRKIIEKFDPEQADAEYSQTNQLPGHIVEMLSHQAWRKTIYTLSERYPNSIMLSAALQHIASQGHQAEMTLLSSASLQTNVFYSLLAECLEKVSPADEENLREKIEKLVGISCQREQTYLVSQYLLHSVRQKMGSKAVGVWRIQQELESHMLDKYKRPQLAINIRLLLDGLVVGGGDRVADAVASIVQGAYAAPGDVASLYKEYYSAVSCDKPGPPIRILQNERVLAPMIDQAFGGLWGKASHDQRSDLLDKYIWLIAYATIGTDRPMSSTAKDELQQLVAQMKELRSELPIHPIQTQIYRAIPKVLHWINTPVLARIVLLWIRDVTTYDNFTYYNTYFTSTEVPALLLLLEEIAYRHPLLKPLVFAAYKDSFESRVPDFLPEKQIKLQKMVINRMAALAQLDYALPILNYFDAKRDDVDESVMVYFLHRLLVQFEAPYPDQFCKPVLELIKHTIDSVKAGKDKEVTCIRDFLASIDGDLARSLLSELPDSSASTPISIE